MNISRLESIDFTAVQQTGSVFRFIGGNGVLPNPVIESRGRWFILIAEQDFDFGISTCSGNSHVFIADEFDEITDVGIQAGFTSVISNSFDDSFKAGQSGQGSHGPTVSLS